MRTRLFLLLALACIAGTPSFVLGAPSAPVAPPAVEQIAGVADVQVEDDFDAGEARTFYRLRTATGEILTLRFEKPPSIALRTGDSLRVSGHRTDDVLDVVQIERDGDSPTSMTSSSWTTGTKKVLVILLNFLNDTTQPYTIAQATATMFGATNSVASYYAENSLGATALTGDVAGWYTATINKPTTCDIGAVQTQAESAAAAHGYVLANYPLKVYVFNHISSCGWSGLASVGSPGAWINQAHSIYVTGHELGHNYGVLHSHSYNCSPNVIGGTCTRSEYGDPFDIMGGGTRHFAGWSKNYFGWMTPSEVYTVPLGASGNYTLSPQELRGGVRGLQINTDAGRTYWLEYRWSTGFDTGIAAQHGALVRIAPSPVGGLDLLDTTPNGNFSDSRLVVGASMTDAAASMRITTMAESGGNLDVNIQFGVTPPTAGFTFSPANPKVGQAVTFTNTSSGFPTTFAWDFGDGQTSTVKNPTHQYSGTGSFTVNLTASNGMGGSSKTGTVPVTAGTALKFYGVTPCRIIDTRTPTGGGALAAGTQRYVQTAGKCGVPTTAVAVAINATVTLPTNTGDISFFAGTANLDFKASQTRSNNAILPLTTTYYLIPKAEMPSGSVHLIIDVSGYYQ